MFVHLVVASMGALVYLLNCKEEDIISRIFTAIGLALVSVSCLDIFVSEGVILWTLLKG